METSGGQKQKEPQVEGSWIPRTPFKPILPKPPVIYTDRQGKQINLGNWLGSEGFSSGFTQETRGDGPSAHFDSANCNWEPASGAKICTASDSIGTCRDFSIDNRAIWDNVSFASLLAAADAAFGASTSVATNRDEHVSLSSKPWINGNYTQEFQDEFPSHHKAAYDLNFPPGSTAHAFSNQTTSQFAPVTPDKAVRVECRQVTEKKYLCTVEKANQERTIQENRIAATGIDTDELQIVEELKMQGADSSLADVSTLLKENQNPDKGGDPAVDLNKTLQQKPRRKKHRPRVITEGKPRTPKPVTPKPAAAKENPTGKRKYVRKNAPNRASTTSLAEATTPTGKRKYVRKNALNKASTTPAAEATNPTGKRKYVRKNALNKILTTPSAEATGETLDLKTSEAARKSCRKALNFDEGQSRDESSQCKPTFTLDSEPQAGDGVGANQSKSTVHLGHGIEVIVENTQAGVAYDLTRSVNQMLKDYISLPSKPAPSTPVPAKSNPPNETQHVNSQENRTEGKIQVTAHNAENTAQIMLQTDTQLSPISLNGSNCSTSTTLAKEGQAKGSKRKHSSFTEYPDTCSTNLTGNQYNALPAYQTLCWVQFPSIYKKKRTEKGQNSTTCSASSFVTAAKDIMRLEMTCPNWDSEGDPSTSKVNYWISTSHSRADGLPSGLREAERGLQYKPQTFGSNLSEMEKSTKKRSRGPTRIRDLASLTRISQCAIQPTYPARQVSVDCNGQQDMNSHGPHTCIEALVAEMRSTLTTKKRTTKRVSLVNSASSSTNDEQSHGKVILYKQNQFSAKSLGAPPEAIWKHMFSVDAVVEQLQHLDINREHSRVTYEEQNALIPYSIGNEKQNALVLYRSDGTMIPLDGSFEPIKKRRPRPKVDLDEETSRVWKLLLENINSEGIDGTDEEKAKWWEEERNVFRGRANSFIARMHLVQGDRRFSPWKGSVVDSVIGVFLTQNVSDHLSSSAFMSLAARFPHKSNSKHKPCYEERTNSVVDKPIVCILDPEETIKWNEMSNQSSCDQSSMTLREIELDEEREVVNSNESSGSSTGIVSSGTVLETYYESVVNGSTTEITEPGKLCYIGEERTTNDAFSSQNSVVSSQNSVDSPLAQTAERKESLLENSETEYLTDGSKLNILNGSTSFVELLQKAGSNMLHEVYSHGNSNISSDKNSKDECNKIQSGGNDFLREKMDYLHGPKSSLGMCMVPSTNCHLHPTSLSGVQEVEHFEIITEKARLSDISKNKREKSMKNHGDFSEQSASQIIGQNKLTTSAQEASGSLTATTPSCNNIQEDRHVIVQSQSTLIEDPQIADKPLAEVQNNEMQQNLYLPKLSRETLDIMQSTCTFDKQEKNLQKTMEPDLIEQGYPKSKALNEMNTATRKAKSRRVGKEIKDNVDWDALRKQTETNGSKRERTANTMDSLDWEAVRCADVNEIANTIKERGMNNLLAARIKDFLNRLVGDHGSIDLEWLRDVPPDKAKEYLLSIRGLGLKSVECVRLLTLHHLAFPVDTNVGRIAVRLGWVPLQPLPESLQLHLLELYPVLESIQKYLWPRLCKLDQHTLYELHYQMITFGKVFCTKSKPNCNACPMRGECRHFASAFASARLALPGPEEKSIVGTTENSTTDQNPAMTVDQLPLPLPQATEQSEENQQSVVNWQSEAKSGAKNCEPIIEEPSSPEPECTQVAENDIEEGFCEDPDEIPTIKLNIEEFTQNLQNYMQNNMELQEGDMSKALVALTAEAASIPTSKLKNVSRLRTEHQVYELPDSHPLLQGLDRREPDDPCSYLLAIWTPGETANSIQPPETRCSSQEYGKLCDEKTCFSCSSMREANSQIVRGTLLIPCRTAMRGSFPLNGTYFQVNEVFADHDSSLNPIDVPRAWLWHLQRRTVYFGTSIPTIFKGLTTEAIQHCFWRGYVCVRGFDQKTRAPRPLMARLHFPASKLTKTKVKDADDQ